MPASVEQPQVGGGGQRVGVVVCRGCLLHTDPQERAKTTTASSDCSLRPRPTAPDPVVPCVHTKDTTKQERTTELRRGRTTKGSELGPVLPVFPVAGELLSVRQGVEPRQGVLLEVPLFLPTCGAGLAAWFLLLPLAGRLKGGCRGLTRRGDNLAVVCSRGKVDVTHRGPGLWDEVCSPKMQWWSLLALADLFVITRPHTHTPHSRRSFEGTRAGEHGTPARDCWARASNTVTDV